MNDYLVSTSLAQENKDYCQYQLQFINMKEDVVGFDLTLVMETISFTRGCVLSHGCEIFDS